MTLTHVPLFPLRQGLFPDGLLGLTIFEVRYLHLIRRCQQEGIAFGIVPLASGHEVQKAGEMETLHPWGCMVELLESTELQPSVLAVRCRGTRRFALGPHARGAYGLWSGEVRLLPDDHPTPIPADLQPLADRLGALIANAQQRGLVDQLPMTPPYRLDDAGWVANRWGDLLPLGAEHKAQLLSENDCEKRLRQLAQWF